MAIPVLWPEPCRKWVRWTEEKKHQHGAVNLKDLERFWMKEWSLISCQVFSNLIRHYRRKLRAVKLANGGFKKYWIGLLLTVCIYSPWLYVYTLISSCVHFWKPKQSTFTFTMKHSVSTTWCRRQQQYYSENNSSAFFRCIYIWAVFCKSSHTVM